jgi:hypothetical protein
MAISRSLVSILGIITIVFFLLMYISGGYFNSVNTFLYREISLSISPFADKNINTLLYFYLFNFSLILFSIFLYIKVKGKSALIGSIFLVLSVITSLILLVFPMDFPGAPLSLVGIKHNLVAMGIALFIVLSLFFYSKAFNKTKNMKSLARYSKTLSAFILITALITGIFAMLNLSDAVGLVQKFPVSAFIIWIFLTSINV